MMLLSSKEVWSSCAQPQANIPSLVPHPGPKNALHSARQPRLTDPSTPEALPGVLLIEQIRDSSGGCASQCRGSSKLYIASGTARLTALRHLRKVLVGRTPPCIRVCSIGCMPTPKEAWRSWSSSLGHAGKKVPAKDAFSSASLLRSIE